MHDDRSVCGPPAAAILPLAVSLGLPPCLQPCSSAAAPSRLHVRVQACVPTFFNWWYAYSCTLLMQVLRGPYGRQACCAAAPSCPAACSHLTDAPLGFCHRRTGVIASSPVQQHSCVVCFVQTETVGHIVASSVPGAVEPSQSLCRNKLTCGLPYVCRLQHASRIICLDMPGEHLWSELQ